MNTKSNNNNYVRKKSYIQNLQANINKKPSQIKL